MRVPTGLTILVAAAWTVSAAAAAAGTEAPAAAEAACTPGQVAVPATATLGPAEANLDQVALSLDALADANQADVVYDYGDDDSYNLVVDPGSSRLADDLETAVRQLKLPVPVSITEGCVSQEELQSIRQQIIELPRPEGAESMALEVDEMTGRVLVRVSDDAFAETLRTHFGSRVEVVVGQTPVLLSRIVDDQPHYGGVRIWRYTCDGSPVEQCDRICTSGFKVIINGTQDAAMTTAGHCGEAGFIWRDGLTEGQSYIMGETRRRHAYPNTDAMVLNTPGIEYRTRIYASPTQEWRDVVSDRSAVEGEDLCQGGAASEETCGLVVRETDTTLRLEDPFGDVVTYYNLDRARADDNRMAGRQGDSGGPVFSRQPDGDAVIHGSVTAGDVWDPPGDGFVACRNVQVWGHTAQACPQLYLTDVFAIEVNVGVQTAHAPE